MRKRTENLSQKFSASASSVEAIQMHERGMCMKRVEKWLSFLTMITLLLSLCAAPALAADNLITNSDFEGGNTGFDTEYTYLDPANTGTWTLGPEGMYTVSTNPNLYHSAWASFGDHTTGTGKMMIVNGAIDSEPKVLWSQDVSLEGAASSPQYWDLWAGSGMRWNVGRVYVTNTDETICVKLILNHKAVNGHFTMTEVHLGIWETLAEIPQKNGNPIPGKFPVKMEFDPGVLEYEYCFENLWEPGTPLCIATHAVMERPETECYPAQSETLWGDCTPFPGKNWARYISYVTQDEEESTYRLAFYARSCYADNPAILEIEVDDEVIGTAGLAANTGAWEKFTYDFIVPADVDTAAVIRDLRLLAHGDDFCIDDISLEKVD